MKSIDELQERVNQLQPINAELYIQAIHLEIQLEILRALREISQEVQDYATSARVNR